MNALLTEKDIDVLISWMNENVKSRGYEYVFKTIRDDKEIAGMVVNDQVREYMIKYFKILLDEPSVGPVGKSASKS